MIVSKLTITPWITGGRVQHFIQPTEKTVATLVKERLSVAVRDDRTARVFRKLPKALKGFVNPKSIVSTERKFSMDM